MAARANQQKIALLKLGSYGAVTIVIRVVGLVLGYALSRPHVVLAQDEGLDPNTLKTLPQIIQALVDLIKAAADSTLGIIALLIIALSLLAYFLFKNGAAWAKMVSFALLFIGAIAFGFAMLRTDSLVEELLTLRGQMSWQESGVLLSTGQRFEVIADGEIRYTTNGSALGRGLTGPGGVPAVGRNLEGRSYDYRGYSVREDWPHAMLIARIGSQLLPIGVGGTFTSQADGPLEFAPNDEDLGNNGGSWTVRITTTPP